MRSIEYRQLISILTDHGCVRLRQKGSHERWQCGACFTTVPVSREIPPGTLRAIERQLETCFGPGWLSGERP